MTASLLIKAKTLLSSLNGLEFFNCYCCWRPVKTADIIIIEMAITSSKCNDLIIKKSMCNYILYSLSFLGMVKKIKKFSRNKKVKLKDVLLFASLAYVYDFIMLKMYDVHFHTHSETKSTRCPESKISAMAINQHSLFLLQINTINTIKNEKMYIINKILFE